MGGGIVTHRCFAVQLGHSRAWFELDIIECRVTIPVTHTIKPSGKCGTRQIPAPFTKSTQSRIEDLVRGMGKECWLYTLENHCYPNVPLAKSTQSIRA